MLNKVFLIVFNLYILLAYSPLLSQSFPQSHFKATHALSINGQTFYVALAQDERERALGLMGVERLETEEGMLFIFEKPTYLSFWMKDTPLALSIAYIDSRGYIKEIYDMSPYDLSCTSSKEPVLYALEVPQGTFKKKGIEINMRVDGLEKLSS